MGSVADHLRRCRRSVTRLSPPGGPLAATARLCSSRSGAYDSPVRTEIREEPCRTALNPVRGMSFNWSLNPYMGCAHRCAFCYVRAFERRADRPSGDAYGASVSVKVNVANVLRVELARSSWAREHVAIGA